MGSNTANILHAAGMLLGTIGLRHGRLYRASARKLQQNRLLMVAASEVPHVTREKLAVSTGHSFLLKCLFQLTKASAKGLNRASGMNRLSVRLGRYLRPSGPSRPNYSAISRVITCRYIFHNRACWMRTPDMAPRPSNVVSGRTLWRAGTGWKPSPARHSWVWLLRVLAPITN